MPIKLGNIGLAGGYLGSTPIIKIYQGSNLVFQKVEEQVSSPVGSLLDKSITTIENDLITEITIIGDYAFYNCGKLKSINLPETITEIGKHSFDGCISLNDIILPSTITTIGDYAFYNCVSLYSITIPANVTRIGSYAFNNLKQITFLSEEPPTINSQTFGEIEKIYVPKESVGAYGNGPTWADFRSIIEGV